MRKALLGLGLAFISLFAVAAYAQTRCGSSLCIGGATTPLAVQGALTVAGAGSKTTCTLNAASPSVCTATVTAGSQCNCSPVGATAAIAAGGCAVGLSGTTVTVTAANSASHVVNILCL